VVEREDCFRERGMLRFKKGTRNKYFSNKRHREKSNTCKSGRRDRGKVNKPSPSKITSFSKTKGLDGKNSHNPFAGKHGAKNPNGTKEVPAEEKRMAGAASRKPRPRPLR